MKLESSDLMGNDQVLKRKSFRWYWIAAVIIIFVTAVMLGYYEFISQQGREGALNSGSITLSPVIRAVFSQTVPFRGRLVPLKQIALSSLEAGRIENIFKNAGDRVHRGDKLIRLINPNLRRALFTQQTDAITQLNQQQILALNASQAVYEARAQLEGARAEIARLQEDLSVNNQLVNKGILAQRAGQHLRNNLTHWNNIYELRKNQLNELEHQVNNITTTQSQTKTRLEQAANQADEQLNGLSVSVPADGILTSLDVTQGQFVQAGERIGNLDLEQGFKVEALFDEFYLPQIKTGQRVQLSQEGLELTLAQIIPDVTKGKFKVFAEFKHAKGNSLRKGQTLLGQVKVSENSNETMILPVGPFWQSSGGQWVFVMTDKTHAEKRYISTGRQDQTSIEILQGLKEGDQVITSSYRGLKDYDTIRID